MLWARGPQSSTHQAPADPHAGSTCMSVPLITANFIKSACASCMQITKSDAVKEINEVGCFSVAIWIAIAAGKCHAPRPLAVACEQGEIAPSWVSHFSKEFRSQDAKLTMFIAKQV